MVIIGVLAIAMLIASILFKLVVVVKKDMDVEAFPQEDRAAVPMKYVAEYNAANGIVEEPKAPKAAEEPEAEEAKTE